jgi:hypothetical protein
MKKFVLRRILKGYDFDERNADDEVNDDDEYTRLTCRIYD